MTDQPENLDPQGKIAAAIKAEGRGAANRAAERVLSSASQSFPSAQTMEMFLSFPKVAAPNEEKGFPIGFMERDKAAQVERPVTIASQLMDTINDRR